MFRRLLAVSLVVVATPAAAQGPIDFSKVQATRDSFVVLVQGTPRGFEVTAVERSADGIVVRDETDLMPLLKQDTEVRLGPGGEMRSVKQRGSMQGQPMTIDVRYLGGRATGDASVPGASGAIERKVVGADVPPGTIDDNVVLPLLVGLPWAPGAAFTLPVFASGQNELRTVRLTVVGTESLTVPAGGFEVYKVELTGLPSPLTLYVNAVAPHRVLKVVPQGSPLEFVAGK